MNAPSNYVQELVLAAVVAESDLKRAIAEKKERELKYRMLARNSVAALSEFFQQTLHSKLWENNLRDSDSLHAFPYWRCNNYRDFVIGRRREGVTLKCIFDYDEDPFWHPGDEIVIIDTRECKVLFACPYEHSEKAVEELIKIIAEDIARRKV